MKAAITIGVLDGVHLGHRALISRLDESLRRTVLTFDPHPVEVLAPGTHPRLLTDIDERRQLLSAAGVIEVVVLDLAEIKEMSPEEFVKSYLIDRLDVGQIVVGSDFRFGKDRAGDVELLENMAADIGCRVDVIDLVADNVGAVSSSRIRTLVEVGEVDAASQLLGSHFVITQTVVHGDKRGRKIGFPTANMKPPSRKVIPATGVYACHATVSGVTHNAAINVGNRPTFGGDELIIEAFILDFDADIYDRQLRLHFVERIRPEIRFDSVDELVKTMTTDVARARDILESRM